MKHHESLTGHCEEVLHLLPHLFGHGMRDSLPTLGEKGHVFFWINLAYVPKMHLLDVDTESFFTKLLVCLQMKTSILTFLVLLGTPESGS